MAKKSVHDMGGDPAGPVDRHEHTPTLSERRVDAMLLLLRQNRRFWTTDEHRRTIESLAPDTYKESGYYEKWAYGMRGLLVEKGIVTEAELAKRLAEVKARHGGAKVLGAAMSKTARSAGKPAAKSAPPKQKPAATAKPKPKAAASKPAAATAKGKAR